MKQTKISRLLAAVAAVVMLFSSMTVLADAPSKADTPTWQDVFDMLEYVGENVYDKDPDFVNDVSEESPYKKEGTLLGDAGKEQAYCAFVEGSGVFAPDNLGDDGEAELEGDAASKYGDFYDAAIALIGSVQEASGTKYVDDIMGEYDSFWETYDKSIWDGVDSGQIITVDSAEDAPDTATMKKGTYWVLGSDLETYGSAVETVSNTSNNWQWGEKGPSNFTRSDVQQCIASVKAAYNTLLGQLHEGEIASKSGKSSKKLKTASYVSDSSEDSQPEEETPAPPPANEVTFSGGVKRQTSLAGEYCQTCMAGVIHTDGQEKIRQAAGLSEKEIADGAVIKCFICNSRNQAMNEILTKTGSAQGYKVWGVINCDLYKLYKGSVTPIRKTGEALTVVLGVPEKLRNDQYEFAVICYDENGNLVMMPDMDTDNATITVQAESFGAWAVLYRTRK